MNNSLLYQLILIVYFAFFSINGTKNCLPTSDYYGKTSSSVENVPVYRRKRDISNKNGSEKIISGEEASQLLNPFDILLAANKNVVAMLLQNIIDILQNFCTQIRDTRLMKASGTTLTYVQAQAVSFATENFTTKSFPCGGSSQAVISMSNMFSELYSNYECGSEGYEICSEICLGTATIAQQAFVQNVYLRTYYFSQYKAAVEFNRSASDFYQVHFEDPGTGLALQFESGMTYTIVIPIINFVPAYYYACFVRSRFEWSNAECTSSGIQRVGSYTYYIQCQCSLPGTISVFIVNPPVPQPYSKFNEILLTFVLSSIPKCTQMQLSSFMVLLSSTSNVDMRRFVHAQCALRDTVPEVQLVLRPPFRKTQMQNSYAVQAIKKIVSTDDNTFLTFGNATVTAFTATVIQRDSKTKNDGYARKMCLHIERSFRNVVGNDSAGTAQRWARSIANTVGISPYRIKNPVVAPDTVFNFTITIPFEEEISPISAEEISLIIKEEIGYGELSLEDRQGTILPVEPLQYSDTIELIPISGASLAESNALMLVTAILVSTAFICSSAVIIFLVVLKIRTDRLFGNRGSPTFIDQASAIVVLPRRPELCGRHDLSASAPATSDGPKSRRLTIRHR